MIKILLVLVGLTALTYAQELNCRVSINYESLSTEHRDILRDFAGEIQDYVNHTSYSDNWDYDRINCNMQIFFISANNNNYTAQVVVSAQRPVYKSVKNTLLMTLNDNTWSFPYERGQSFYQNTTTYDPLTGFLDYYAYVILGFYMESWEELGGSPYFYKAFDIVNLGANSAFSTGWEKNSNTYSRRGLVEDVINDKYRPFRIAYYDYYYGIDVMSTHPDEGLGYIVGLINTLDDLRKKVDLNSVLIKMFFDAKNEEIIDYLKNYNDKEIFKKLKRIDPGHTSKYDAMI